MFDEYFDFLKNCKKKEYGCRTQDHHIVPKKLGGSDENENLIELSYEDHEKAHLVLAECFQEDTYEKNMNLWSARLIRKQSNLSDEEWEKISQSMTGENNPFYGETHDEETKKILAKKVKEHREGKSYEEIYGEERAEEERKKRAKKTRTDEEYERDAKKISEALKGGTVAKGNNPNAQPYLVDGEKYSSRVEVVETFDYDYLYQVKNNHNVEKL